MAGRGGRRSGAGRPKGSITRRTKARLDIAAQALAKGKSPLEIMVEAMHLVYAADGAIAAMPYAREVAPFMHPKLAAVQARIAQDPFTRLVNAIPVTELAAVEAMLKHVLAGSATEEQAPKFTTLLDSGAAES